MQIFQQIEDIKKQVLDGKLNEAHASVVSLIEAIDRQSKYGSGSGSGSGSRSGREPLPSDLIQVIAGLVKFLSLNSNFRLSEDLLTRTLGRTEPKDDHYFLNLADELIHKSEVNVLTTRENAARCDKLLDQAIRIRENLIGIDNPTVELLIESVLTNLSKARQCANNNLAAESAARLTRCRQLMARLQMSMENLPKPPDVLMAKYCTLRAFFAHTGGNKAEAKNFYENAISVFETIAAGGNLEQSDIFDMFIEQAGHFTLSTTAKQSLERIRKAKISPKRQPTMHKIRAFPSTDHIEALIKQARGTPNKSFQLTSLGFLGAQSLVVSAICRSDTGHINFRLEPIKIDSKQSEPIELSTEDSAEVLRHIKDLWRKLQPRPASDKARSLPITYSATAFDQPPRQTAQESTKAVEQFSSGIRSTSSGNFPRQIEINSRAGFESPFDSEKESPSLLKPDDTARPPLMPLHSAEEKETLSFEGSLKALPSFGLIQTISLNKNSGILEVTHSEGVLQIYFDAGKPVHAVNGDQAGIDVLYQFILQEDGFFRFIPNRRPDKQTIQLRVESFILEAATLFDETKYLNSLGLTKYSGLFPREYFSDLQALEEAMKRRGAECDENTWNFYEGLQDSHIATEVIEHSELNRRQWTHALYQLVMAGLVTISNDGFDDEDISARLVSSWSYDRKKVDEFTAKLHDPRTGLLRFEFLVWLLEREFERARTQMWPLAIIIFEFRKRNKTFSEMVMQDKDTVLTTLAEIADCKRSIDWFAHFEDDQFAVLTPGLDINLASMFARNFVDICTRNLGKLRDGQSDWEYSFGVSSIPGDTIEWQKMVGFACEAQRKARIKSEGFTTHADATKKAGNRPD